MTLFGCLPGLLGLSWGVSGAKKCRQSNAKTTFLKVVFLFSELHLALLGSSIPLPGQSWGPDGSQKTSKSGPKFGQKLVQKGIQFWAALGPILGPVLGSKTVGLGGPFFNVFFSKIKTSLETFVFFMLPLGDSCRHQTPIHFTIIPGYDGKIFWFLMTT